MPGLITMRVRINGTGRNPWHRLNLQQNPFPQIGRAEFEEGERRIHSLDGDPVRSPQDIRERLEGFSEEFVTGCIERWRPGQRTEFEISFPDPRGGGQDA
jgi:hypothetical protein